MDLRTNSDHLCVQR